MKFTAGDKILESENISINPAKAYVNKVKLPADVNIHELRASISVNGKELAAYSPIRLKPEKMPEPVRAPAQPENIKTVEELYLTGLWIEQFHSPSLEPDPYWEEALRRDPCDVRVNIALGINYLKKAKFAEAEKLFLKALERLTYRYTSPKDGEPFYYLGVALKAQGKKEQAYDKFFKATWSMAWRAASYYSLAEIDCMNNDFDMALENVDNSLAANALNIRALTLKAAVLRHKGKNREALNILKTALDKSDPLDVRIMAEYWLAGDNSKLRTLLDTLKDHTATGLETAAEYANAGLWADGSQMLLQLVKATSDKSKVSPLAYYYLGYFAEKMNQKKQASDYYSLAAKMSPDYVFPFQWEAISVLEHVMEVSPKDAYAPSYLGNLLFNWQPDRAVSLWEKSSSLKADYPIVYRNLAMVYRRQNKLPEAIINLEKAVNSAASARHLFELDQLYEQTGADPVKRLQMFEKNHNIALQRDDAISREIALKVFMGKYDQAIELLENRKFSVWEGGARFNVSDPWTNAHLLRGRSYLSAKQYEKALADFQKSIIFPENLQEANLASAGGNRSAEVAYWTGIAYEGVGDMGNARKSWEQSASGGSLQAQQSASRQSRRGERGGRRGAPGTNMNLNYSVQNYYQGLSLMKLGRQGQAQDIFKAMVTAGNQMLEGIDQQEFFTSFGAQQSQRGRIANAHYITGLGNLGLNEKENAVKQFRQALEIDPAHLGAKTMLVEND